MDTCRAWLPVLTKKAIVHAVNQGPQNRKEYEKWLEESIYNAIVQAAEENAELAPHKEEQDSEENKQVNTSEIPGADIGSVTPPSDTNKTMVAEPSIIYNYGGITNNLRKGCSI